MGRAAAGRSRDASLRALPRRRAEARRHRRAVGRAWRRQDDARARDHPGARRRRDARDPKPDLHADPVLRHVARSRGARRSLSRERPRGAPRARLRGGRGGGDRARRMAGAGRFGAEPGPARHRNRARAGRGRAHRLPQRLRRGCGAPRAGAGRSRACRDERLGRSEARAAARRCLDASLRAARQADRRNGDPDDLAAAAGRPGGAARQALQRDREARRVRARFRRPRSGPARPRLQRARDLWRRSRDRAPDPRGPRQRAGGRRRGPDPGALRGGDAAPRAAARRPGAGRPSGRRRPRARGAGLRPRGLPDRGRAPARLVCAAHPAHPPAGLGAGRVRECLDGAPGRCRWPGRRPGPCGTITLRT